MLIPSNANTPWDALARDAFNEFSDVLDYIWKSPRLLEAEEKIEIAKLEEFADTPAVRDFRWRLESRNLYELFPVLMANGNLFMVTSIYELFVFQLATLVEQRRQKPLTEQRGQGLQRTYAYMRDSGVKLSGNPLWAQIEAITKIRNCLTHANGVLRYSRDEGDLRRIVHSRTYLSIEHRGKVRTSDLAEITISESALGDQLKIQNYFSWIAAVYLRDYFVWLADATKHSMAKVQPVSSESA